MAGDNVVWLEMERFELPDVVGAESGDELVNSVSWSKLVGEVSPSVTDASSGPRTTPPSTKENTLKTGIARSSWVSAYGSENSTTPSQFVASRVLGVCSL